MPKPLIAVTMGDPAGVGPEVCLQLLANEEVREFALQRDVGEQRDFESLMLDANIQLVQLNAVLNSMTVRSDYYAVWFVVQGFKESDTQDLSDTDPLVPSFKARYLMIVDRSNVTEKGDRPHVLAFVQLPMLPDPSTATN